MFIISLMALPEQIKFQLNQEDQKMSLEEAKFGPSKPVVVQQHAKP